MVSGCQSFDPTRLWKLNRGEDYMNNDQYFSIPAQKLSSTPPTPEADRPEEWLARPHDAPCRRPVTEDNPMRRDTRKQPWQTFPFWFLILSGMAMTMAWKLDLLRPQLAPVTKDGSVIEEELAPDWAAGNKAEAEAVTQAEEQTEPVLPQKSARTFPEGTEADLASAPELPETAKAEMPSEEPAPEPETPVNPFAKTAKHLAAAPPSEASSEEPKTASLVAAAPQSTRPQSPFGPAKIEVKGTRQPKTPETPAISADPGTESAAVKATSSEIIQTAAIESVAKRNVAAVEQALAKTEERTLAKSPAASTEAVDLTAIDKLIADGEDVEANFQMSNLYWKRPEIRKQLEDRLRAVSYKIYFAPQPHYMDGYVVQSGDVLQRIAKDYNISWEYLAKLNRSDPKKIRPGQKLKVIRGPFSAVVDLSDMEITIHSHGHFVHVFPIGIGSDSSTPYGTFKVLDKQRDPTYYGPNGVIEHDDLQNPLGEYWIDLGDSYGIHGTIDESSIGKTASQGCIRMKNSDIEDVFDLLTVGSEVLIRR